MLYGVYAETWYVNDLDCTFEKVFGNGKAAEFICNKILRAI